MCSRRSALPGVAPRPRARSSSGAAESRPILERGIPVPARRIIFLDVDGTIMTYGGVIPASAKRAIAAARAAGHVLFLCTGRSKAEIPSELAALGFDGMIGGNGSYVEHHGDIVMHQTIPLDQCCRIVDCRVATRQRLRRIMCPPTWMPTACGTRLCILGLLGRRCLPCSSRRAIRRSCSRLRIASA